LPGLVFDIGAIFPNLGAASGSLSSWSRWMAGLDDRLDGRADRARPATTLDLKDLRRGTVTRVYDDFN
jgi:hypothetical protein